MAKGSIADLEKKLQLEPDNLDYLITNGNCFIWYRKD